MEENIPAFEEPRLDFDALVPRFSAAMGRLDSVAGVGLDPLLRELVRLHASTINGCAYCVDMHSKDARAAGETEQRLYSLGAWREAPWFSAGRARRPGPHRGGHPAARRARPAGGVRRGRAALRARAAGPAHRAPGRPSTPGTGSAWRPAAGSPAATSRRADRATRGESRATRRTPRKLLSPGACPGPAVGIELGVSEGLRSGRRRSPGNSYFPGLHLFSGLSRRVEG